MGKLDGKVALVTGGSSGLGLATAQQFVAEGAYVFITGRRKPELDAAVRRIGKNVIGVQGDTSKLADLDDLYAQIKKEKGTLDIIFANAGGGSFLPLGQITEQQYQETFDVNVKGVIFTVQKALPLLKDGSSIILNASVVASKGTEAFSVYSATKAAVRNLARGFTVDLKSRNIRVNAVSPGPFLTEGFKGLVTDEAQLDAFVKGMSAQIPAGRTGNVEELAKSVVFLASDDSSYIRAAELVVDGGFSQV